MSNINPKGKPLKIGGREYNLIFTINVIDDIQDHFDISIDKLSDLISEPRKQFKVIRYILTALINESIEIHNEESPDKWDKIDERYVGRHMTTSNLKEFADAILGAFADGTPIDDGETYEKNS